MEAFIGSIILFAGNFPPRGWAFCHGQLLPIRQYPAVFSLLGSVYGGDSVNTFALPDLRSRVPLGSGQGTGLGNYPLGSRGGVEAVTLTAAQLPAHTHPATQALSTVSGGAITGLTATLSASQNGGDRDVPTAGAFLAKTQTATSEGLASYIADNLKGNTVNLGGLTVSGGSITGANVTNGAITVGPTGGNQAHENRQPYLALNYIICLEGIYPSRND